MDCRFANLGAPGRIFAIPAIHGQLQKLHAAHESLFQQFRPGDRLVYLGNYTGYGEHSRQTIDSILCFRRCLLSIPGVKPTDIIFLRGIQEEMWQKLMQLQFAPNPSHVLGWMLDRGLAQTMESYGIDIREASRISHEGVIRIARWTEKLRQVIHANAGHTIFGSQLKRAAYTDCAMKQTGVCSPLLFVNAGIEPSRSLEEQGDNFWLGSKTFTSMITPYNPYHRVIRGYDPEQRGYNANAVTATLDNNCGRGGNLISAQFAADGQIIDLLEH